MAPSPQEVGVVAQPSGTSNILSGNEVVISGISGVFPSSDNTKEFAENLLNNVDLVTEDDLNFRHPEAPKHLGKINGMDKFDAQFFKVTYYHALDMEPQCRKLLEQAYTAMYDSGINPLAYKGKKVGVFVGSSYSDTSSIAMFRTSKTQSFCLSGCSKSMFANRISYWIDAKGPSYNLDCACASSMVCFEHAYSAITKGECEAAVVGACNVCYEPNLGLNLRRTGTVSLDGKTRCFDKRADGAVRAEAINCVFLQKAKDAKRIYAEVVFADVTYGLKEDAHFLTMGKKEDLERFLNEFYQKAKVSPNSVEYVEANGAAVCAVDTDELETIDKVFASNRTIKVGSIKSNMGHSESASGLCAITKLCLAYHKGKLPANLHYSDPLDIQGVKEGRIQILKNNETFDREYTAVNNFSMLGTKCHVLLKGHYKKKDKTKYISSIPRLVVVSGRADESVNKLFDVLESQPMDPEIIGMLHNIYQIDTPGHTSRGYAILDTNENNETVTLARNAAYFSGIKRQLWLVFSGMGSQWPGMAADLMKIPTFASSIMRCHNALKPFGVDLVNILTNLEKATFDKITNCFIGITAVQIGLSDILKEIGINPDYVIGHSQGEMACAYWDNSFTCEETILAAYSRGVVSSETKFIKGGMAAVGLGYQNIKSMCPPEIDVACHNSSDSATLSGPADILKAFVEELTAKGIFAREVPSTGIAFHSRYIKHGGSEFLKRMKEIIPNPKLRSEKWISTSIPQDRWNEEIAKYSSAEYHTNNLLSSVLFEEASQLIPKDAVVIEVAPHGLLQAILKRSHPECVHIPLTKRGEVDQTKFLLENFGKIYQEGFNMKMENLYPKIEYPVSTETEMISHYVEWEHSETWPEIKHQQEKPVISGNRDVMFSIKDDDFKFLNGFVRDGNNTVSESAILFYVWETLAMYKCFPINEMSVAFRNVIFFGEVITDEEKIVKLSISLNKGNDYFEVCNDGVVIATGYIAEILKPSFEFLKEDKDISSDEDNYILSTDDVYKHLHYKGLSYSGEFQSIDKAGAKGEAQVKWTENWITFLDSLIQLNILNQNQEGLSIPKIIKNITINCKEQNKVHAFGTKGFSLLDAKYYDVYGVTRCAGVEIRDLILETRTNKKQLPDVLESLAFTPFTLNTEIDIASALQVNLQIIADNTSDDTISVVEVTENPTKSLRNIIDQVTGYIPNIEVKFSTVPTKAINKQLRASSLIIIQDLMKNGTNVAHLLNEISKNTFVLVLDDNASKLKNCQFNIISSMKVQGKDLLLLKKIQKEDKTYIKLTTGDKFSWVSTLQSQLQKSKRVILISERQPHCGLYGLVKQLKRTYSNKIGLVVIDDYAAPSFDENNPVFRDQIMKNLTFNILHKGVWGSYCYIPNAISTNSKDFKLVNVAPGEFDGLKWVETNAVPPSDNTVQVCFAGTSLRDCQKAIGISEDDGHGFGLDFSGIDINGERVMGLLPSGALANTVQADPHLLWPVPKHWSLEEAATVPLPYAHAFYCLAIKGTLQKHHTVFVTGGAGALGQAVIALCLSLGCKVFTSVSDIHKKRFLLKLFPQLEEKHIACTVLGGFKEMILTNNDRLCDFVINCASGAVREALMKCVGVVGVFLDVSHYDSRKNKPIGMSYVENDNNYYAVNLQTVFKPEFFKEKKKLQWMLAQGIISGAVKPLSRILYPASDIPKAFRMLNMNRHRGRVIIRIKDADAPSKNLNIVPRVSYSSNGTYVIVCDKTDLGIELANRLVRRGARKLALHLKSKNISGLLHMKLAAWKKLNTTVTISTEKIQIDRNCAQFLNNAVKIGRVKGIFIVLEQSKRIDGLNQEIFIDKYENDIMTLANLDVVSRNNCPELSTFAVISQSPKNAVDAYTVSVSDKICQARVGVGLPGVSFKIEHIDEKKHHSDKRLQAQHIETVFNALEISMRQKSSNFTTYNLKRRDHEFLEQINKWFSFDNIDEVDESLTVGDFVTNELALEVFRSIIKNTTGYEYLAEDVKEMTLARLKSLGNARQENKEISSGLEAFYSVIDQDEITATNILVPIQTLIQKDTTVSEVHENASHLILIPGFEGNHRVFSTAFERLKIRAMVAQIVPDLRIESIPELARNILQYIKKTFVFKSKFYLLGYSFGLNVALELAALLEKEGLKGVIFCVDSSPDALRAQIDAHIGSITDSQLQNIIIDHMFTLMCNRKPDEISEEIKNLNTWSEKVDLFITKVNKYVTLSKQYQRNILDSAYKRILLVMNYKPELKLDSQLVLLKGTALPESEGLEFDYGLHKFSNRAVEVIDIISCHKTAPQDGQLANIVNRFLDSVALEEFSCKNHCYTYLVPNVEI